MSRENGPRYEMPKQLCLENYDSESLKENQKDVVMQNESTEKIKTTKKKYKKIAVIAAIATIALVVGIIVIIQEAVPSFNNDIPEPDNNQSIENVENNIITLTEEDVDINFIGYNGVGKISMELKQENVLPMILKAMGINSSNPSTENRRKAKAVYDAYELFVKTQDDNGKDIYVTECKNLSNGKKIEIALVKDGEVDENVEIILELNNLTLTCIGLEDLREIDVFKEVEVSFSGEDGSITAKCFYTGNKKGVNDKCFAIKGENGKLSNGDEIEVYVTEEWEERLHVEYGIILENFYKIFTVTIEEEFVLEIDDITPENMEYMINDGLVRIENWAEKQGSNVIYKELSYFGTYLYSLSEYDNSEIGIENRCVMVYSVQIFNTDRPNVYINVYIPVVYRNIVNTADGTQSIDGVAMFGGNIHYDADSKMTLYGYRGTANMMEAVLGKDEALSVDTTDNLSTLFYNGIQ